MIVLAYLALAPQSTVQAQEYRGGPPAVIEGPATGRDLLGHISYLLDPDWELGIDQATMLPRESWQEVERVDPNFGYIKDKVWLRIELVNGTRQEHEWRLHMRENFKQVMDVYVRRDSGTIEHVLSLDRESTYHDRPIPYPEMVAPFVMDTGEHVTVYIAYWSEGSTYLQLALQTADSFAIAALEEFARNFIYYGMMVIFILTAFGSWLILRQSVFLAYVAYAGNVLIFIMHVDGVAFQYLWPNLPAFNSVATVVLGGALTISSAVYARVFLQTSLNHPMMDRLLWISIFVMASAMVSGFFVDLQSLKLFMIPLSLVTMGICAASGVVAGFTRFREVRFYIFAWIGAVVSAAIMNLRHVVGLNISQDVELDSIRIAMVFDAAMMGMALFDRYVLLRRSRQKALEESLFAAEQNLEMNERMSQLEAQYELANELVASRDVELQNTVHDLRKPLHALRLSISKLGDKQRSEEVDRKQVEDALQYMEGLIAGQLQESVHADDGQMASKPDAEILHVPDILAMIHEMFLPDAEDKGLDLRYVPTTLTAPVEPLVLTRIVANLVSNAVKYTSAGKVLIGVRRDGEAMRIEVHDTGPGMNGKDFERAKQRTVRLEEEHSKVDGNGLGLSIAATLAESHGYSLVLLSEGAAGTSIALVIGKSTTQISA